MECFKIENLSFTYPKRERKSLDGINITVNQGEFITLIGKSGSGKSYLSEILAQNLDMIHIDIDKISHKVLTFENTKDFLLKEFGSKIFDNEILNRKQLGTIVFSNPEKLEKLNKFCQIEIEKELDRIIKDSTKSIILDYALLVGLKQFELCLLLTVMHWP